MTDALGRATFYPCGFDTVTVSTSAVVLDNIPTNAEYALIYVADQAIRWRADAAPTGSVGLAVAAGDSIDWTTPYFNYSSLLKMVRFIRDGAAGSDATITVVYFTTAP